MGHMAPCPSCPKCEPASFCLALCVHLTKNMATAPIILWVGGWVALPYKPIIPNLTFPENPSLKLTTLYILWSMQYQSSRHVKCCSSHMNHDTIFVSPTIARMKCAISVRLVSVLVTFCVLALYMLLGAVIFTFIELPHEKEVHRQALLKVT